MAFSFEQDSRGYLKKRESSDLEYKQNFQLGDNLLKYIKTLVGMANNKGGDIIFGIQDSPHKLLGMTNTRFSEIDPKDIDGKIREYFSPNIKWTCLTKEYEEKRFGILHVDEAEEKPIVCKKNNNTHIFREGAIYYRYRGETKEIEYAELRKILDKEKEKERILWIKHIEKISMVGPKNVCILDEFNGDITIGNNKVLLDPTILDKIRIIKEGHFTEKEGEGIPTLKLVGTIDGVIDTDNTYINPNVLYPLTTKQLQEKLDINCYQMQAIIYHLDLKNKPKRHTTIFQGTKSNPIHKYSESLVSIIKKLMEKDKQAFINECVEDYKTNHPRTTTRRRRSRRS